MCSNRGIALPILRNVVCPKRNNKTTETVLNNDDEERLRPGPIMADFIPNEIVQSDAEGNILRYNVVDVDSAEELSNCHIQSADLESNPFDMDIDMHNTPDKTNTSIDDMNLIDLLNVSDNSEQTSSETHTHKTSTRLSINDALRVLTLLQTHKQANKARVWDNRTVEDVSNMWLNEENLMKFKDVELRVLVKYLKGRRDIDNSTYNLKESDAKYLKLEKLCKVFAFEENQKAKRHQPKPRIQNRTPKSLSALSKKIISGKQMPKEVLNIIYARFCWPAKLQKWREDSPLKDDIKIEGTEEPQFWFYIPEYSSKRNQLEVKCIDSSHLLTRTRRKICKGGIESMTNHPWMKVALQRNTYLSLVMVEDIVDPMSVPMALTHISEQVEQAMISNGDLKSASFCHDFREWWQSEDTAGINAAERISMRTNLRERLLKHVDFGRFPPPGAYVKGWPSQLWEALLASIDAKAILYSLCKNGTYNVRAFSSMMCETFFSELYHQDQSGHGAVSAEDFSHFIGGTIEQLNTRLDTDR